MPYIISLVKWPSDKTGEVMKKALEANKKFPDDESLGEGLTSGNAIKADEGGVKSITVLNVSKGKLEEAYNYSQAVANFYALSIEGLEYKIEVWSTIEEAYASVGQQVPK